MAKRKSKIKLEKKVQDLKASIAAKSGTDDERSIEHSEQVADIHDGIKGATQLIDDLAHDLVQLARLLEQHVPDWRERVALKAQAHALWFFLAAAAGCSARGRAA
jgi:hypothetical protein